MDRHVRDELRTHPDPCPSAGHGGSEWLSEPLLAAVLDRVEGGANRSAERGTPVELEERRWQVARQPDRNPGRGVQATIQGGHARIAQRRALAATADTVRRQGCVERLVRRAPQEVDHLSMMRTAAYPPLT